MQLKTGDRIGDYEVLGVLGAGGMGSVYKVRNVISDRVEAIKLLLPNLVEHQDLKERFLREIKTSASLEHPAIAGLRTAFQSGDMLLMVMEFVDGQTLDARLRQGQPSIEESVRITASVLDALEYAHSRGVVHRDIKPANIMLAARGGVKLLDFGIAKATTDKQITVAGTTMGSLYYMSPEQIRGEQVDGRADLYSLGITLYELTTGKRPFGGESGYAIMAEHLQKQPEPPIALAPGLPPALSAVILRSLAKNPDDRYQTAAEFRQDLLSVLSPEESTLILGHSATRPAAQQTAATVPSASPVAAFAAQATQAAAPPAAPPVKATPPPSMQPPVAPAPAPAPAPQPAPFAAMDAPRSAPAPNFAPPASVVAAPRKPSNTLALVMVALIAVVVLGAVLLVFAGSWFFGSSDTTMANAQPTLAQRIGSLFSSSASSDGSNPTPPAPDASSQEPGEPESSAPLEAEALMAANTPGTSPANSQISSMAAPSRSAATSTPLSSSSAPAISRPQSIQGSGSSAASASANTASAQLSASPGGSYSGVAQTSSPSSSASAVPAGPDPRELESAQDFLSKLGIRAGTIQESARKLSEEQSSMGVSLRADMRASMKRMEYLMDQAEAALSRGNLQQAQQHMQGAEREIEKLEKFFRI